MNDWYTLEAVADGWTQDADGRWVAPVRERSQHNPADRCVHCGDEVGDYPSQSGCCDLCDTDFGLADERDAA